MKPSIPIMLVLLFHVGHASASGSDRAFCISFEKGAMTNSCSSDLDVTWCHSDSLSSCTDRWKSDSVRAGGRTTADFDQDDEDRLFALIYACDRGDSACLKARNEFKQSKSR